VPLAAGQHKGGNRDQTADNNQFPLERAVMVIGVEPEHTLDPIPPSEREHGQEGGDGGEDGLQPK